MSCVTTFSLKARNFANVNRWCAERYAPCLSVLRLVHDFGNVQQRLGRDAAAIEAHAARVRTGIDERDLHAAIGGVERSRIAARTGANDRNLG